MLVVVNGEERELSDGTTIADYVQQEGHRVDRIAVEVNGEIVPKARYAQTQIHDRDAVEVVCFVGGG